MRLVLALIFAMLPLCAVADDEHVKVSLLGEQSALVPGTTAWFGIRLEHDPHWHTYWINPGDSGLATKLHWQLPAGFHAGDIGWPAPQRIAVGDLYNFGYEGDVVLPVGIDVPAEAKVGAEARIGVEVKYLVCREQCIPGKADLALDLPVDSNGGVTASAKLIEAARAAQPTAAHWTGTARLRDDDIDVTLHGPDLATVADAFVVARKLTDYSPPRITRHGDELTLSFAKSDYFVSAPARVDLVVRAGAQARSVNVPFVSSP